MIKRPENLMLLPYFPMKFVNGGGQLKRIDYQPYLTCEQAFHGALFALPSESLNRELARRPNNTKHSCYLSISRIPRRLDYQPLFGKWARATSPEIEHTIPPCTYWCLKLCNELGLNLKPEKVNHHMSIAGGIKIFSIFLVDWTLARKVCLVSHISSIMSSGLVIWTTE